MDYRELNNDQSINIVRGRLAKLEEHHFRLVLDQSDAEALDDSVTLENAKTQLSHIETQIANTLAILADLEEE